MPSVLALLLQAVEGREPTLFRSKERTIQFGPALLRLAVSLLAAVGTTVLSAISAPPLRRIASARAICTLELNSVAVLRILALAW